ncbi:MAG: HAMP domain-containing protein [Calditrichaeota bacterium]|nr:MAG: HAMP domain-containing protein [Calditrichota bacterium]
MHLHLQTRLRLLKRKFKRVLSRKIATRLIFTYIGLGALPLVIVSIFLISLTQDTVQSYIYQRNMEIARRASNEIYLFIKEPLTILQTTTRSRDINEMDPFSQSFLINKLKAENPIFRKIFVMNDSGIVTVTTKFGEEQADFSQEPFFRKGIQGMESISEVYFTPSHFPLLLISEPILKFNQVVGVLAAEIDLNHIWTLVDSITIGKTGFAMLLSNKGQVIAHRDKEKVLKKENYSRYSFFQELQEGQSGITHVEEGDAAYIVVYVPVPKLGWGLVVQQSLSEAFTLAHQMRSRVYIFVAITTLIAGVLGILSVQRFTRPLETLVKGVREYERGNLQHRIEMKTRDELAELAQEFNSMANSLLLNQKELQRMERLAALSRFASLVSHEVRNPLNSMNINMQILKRMLHRTDIPAERKDKYLDVIATEINRINNMVTNFLTIARPPELNLIRTNLHDILEEVLLIQEAQAHEQGVKIIREFTSSTPCGMFDHDQMKQVFHNIIINAFDAMKEGGELRIRTSFIHQDPNEDEPPFYLRIEFQDTGIGIPQEIIQEVFEFYYTTKQAGSGIGLAIAKQIVEGHQGIIYIQSQKGKGTTVVIELPVDPPQINEVDDVTT